MIGIYKFQNKINSCIYIGQSLDIERRYKDHINRAKNNFKSNSEYDSPLHRAIRKYGIENFIFEIIEECSKEQLNEREQYWIAFYNSYNNGYNCTTGGNNAEHSKKFDDDFITIIQQLLIENQMTYEEIHKKYNISMGRISEINTGKVGYNNKFNYPLRTLKKIEKYICPICKKQKNKNAEICSECYKKSLKNGRPNREELKKFIRTMSFTQIAQKYNVTDNAIRKWCDAENLPRRKRDIQKYSDKEWESI